MCDEGDLIFAGVGAGAIKDPVAAFERYLEAATRHAHVPAMARVARCYASGEGAPFNLSESSAWAERGAAAGDADAVNLLGARREAGDRMRGEPADVSAAAALYRRAAELGSVEGARNHARARSSSDSASRRRIPPGRRRGTRKPPPPGTRTRSARWARCCDPARQIRTVSRTRRVRFVGFPPPPSADRRMA